MFKEEQYALKNKLYTLKLNCKKIIKQLHRIPKTIVISFILKCSSLVAQKLKNLIFNLRPTLAIEASLIFRWRIENFSRTASRNDPNSTLKGPVFKLRNGTEFYLRFNPTNKKKHGDTDYCSLYLVPFNLAGYEYVSLDYLLWIENKFGERLGHYDDVFSNDFMSSKEDYGYPEYVNHTKLYGSRNKFVIDGVVFMCCEIGFIRPLTKILSPFELKLREKLYSFYDQSSSENCIIQVGEQNFNVSKAILMSHSRVFDRMFNSGMQEEQENMVRITDVSPEIIECFIKYLYLGEIDNLEEVANHLFVLADKYEIKNLQEECVEVLSKEFNKENVLERLYLAFAHNDKILKQSVLAYICDKTSDGNFNYILKTEDRKELASMHAELTSEITDAIFSQIC